MSDSESVIIMIVSSESITSWSHEEVQEDLVTKNVHHLRSESFSHRLYNDVSLNSSLKHPQQCLYYVLNDEVH